MAHDEWRASLRINRADSAALAAALIDVATDGLQHAGNAVLAHLDDPAFRPVAVTLVAALLGRDWEGDTELAATIQRHLDGQASDLTAVPVDLDELGEALDESPGIESLLNLDTASVWPGQLLDVGQEPDGYDPDDPGTVGRRCRARLP